jgi:competence protein ComEA
MSDLSAEPPRPAPPRTWRDQLAVLSTVDLSPARLVVGVLALVVAGVVGWRLIAPPAPAAEMQLPFAEQAGPNGDGAGAASVGGSAAVDPTGGSTGSGGAAPVPPGSGPRTVPGSSGGLPAAASAPGGEVVVHVVGAVATPGVQRLPAGTRVVDAVEAAGGASPEADLARINLAAVLVDGQQIYVARVGEAPPVPLAGSAPSGREADAASGALGLVDLNTATADELDELPGVGPTTAQAIISHREQNGPFTSVDELLDVRGIGDAKLEQLRDLVTV